MAVRKRNNGLLKPLDKRLEIEEVSDAIDEVLNKIKNKKHVVLRNSTHVDACNTESRATGIQVFQRRI